MTLDLEVQPPWHMAGGGEDARNAAGSSAVVIVLTRGCTLIAGPSLEVSSSAKRTAWDVSLIKASGVTEPGSTPRWRRSLSALPERQPASTQHLAQALEVDRAVFERHHQPHLLLLVAQEEVLDVMARQVAAPRLGLLDGEDGRVRDAAGWARAELVEPLE